MLPSGSSTTPIVSVVIPAFNASGCIDRAVESVRAQTLQEFEIVIVDDVSTDDTVAVVERMAAADPRVRLVRSDVNGGPSAARNRGFLEAKGKWIAILDADDAFKPERLETLIARAEAQQLDAIADNIDIHDYHADVTIPRVINRLKTFDGAYFHLTLEEFLKNDFVESGYQFGLMKPIFRAAFMAENNISYPTAYRHGEDSFIYSAVLASKAKMEISKAAYYLYTPTFGPVSRKISEFSRTNTDYIKKAASCDDFLSRFATSISPEARRLVEARKARMLAFREFLITLESRRSLGPVGTVKRLLQHPSSLQFLPTLILGKVRSMLPFRSNETTAA